MNSWKENRALLRTASIGKVANAFQNYWGYRKAIKEGNGVHPAMPIALSVEPTTSCNLRCPECPSGLRSFTRPTGMLDPALLENLILSMKGTLWYVNLYFQGEPMLNPNFFELVEICKKHNVFVNTSTNGHYLTQENAEKLIESGLDRLIVSLDGITSEVYKEYRVGGKIEKVLEGVDNLNLARKMTNKPGPATYFQTLLTSSTEHQVGDIRKLAREKELDGTLFKTMQVNDLSIVSPYLPSNPKYSRYEITDKGSLKIRGKQQNECWRMWSSAVITWDGKVVPCCFDKDATHVMGDISKIGFKEIWNSAPYLSFRKMLFQDRKNIDICSNCSEGTKVWANPTD